MAAKITVNGIAYDSVDAMPPEARRVYEQTVARLPELADRALRAARTAEPTVKKSEIKLSFQLTGPGLKFRKTFGAPSPSSGCVTSEPTGPVDAPESTRGMTSDPIQPDSTEGGVRVALIIGGCGVIGFVLWLLTRPH